MRFFWLIIAALLLAGCSSGSKLGPVDPPAPLSEYTPTLKVTPVWARQLGKGTDEYYLRMRVLTDGERIFSANHAGIVEAFGSAHGKRLWRVDVGQKLSAGPGDGGDLLLLGSGAEVIALSKADGHEVWRAPVSSEVLSAPVMAAGVVGVRSVDGGIFALDASSGKRLWQSRQDVPLLTLRGTSRPLIEGDVMVCGEDNGRLIGLDLHSGQELWDTTVAVPHGRTDLARMVDIDGQMQVVDNVVYVVSYQGRVAAVTVDTGRLLWARDISSYTGLAVAGDYLYLTDSHGDIWALDRNSGGTMWKQAALHGRVLSAPTVQGDFLVVGDYDGYLHWLARDDGHLVARTRIHRPDYYFPAPSVPDDNGYVEKRNVLAPPAEEGYMVYAMDERGMLNAFRIAPLKP